MANVLASAVQQKNPDAEILMVNGFPDSSFMGHIFYEKFYMFSCNYFPGAYSLVYDSSHFYPIQTFILNLIFKSSYRYIRKIFLREKPTDVVSFHFAMSPVAKSVIDNLNFSVRLKVVVTDPFTAHPSWFYNNDLDFLVCSEAVKKLGIEVRQVPPENISVVPVLLNEKYKLPLSESEKKLTKTRLGFDVVKKLVLLVGGGEGLPHASEIVHLLFSHKPATVDFSVAVVCGRNKFQYEALLRFQKKHPDIDLHVFGFVDFLDSLVKISDCVVTKAGPSMLMEILCARKPAIISTYIHNQELGNMRFAVYNNVGFFIQKPRAICQKIIKILNDDTFEKRMQKNFDALKLDTDASVVAEKLLGE